MKTMNNFVLNPKEVRRRLGLNQQTFWSKIGVTQSGGSRYESGRHMPKPVQELLRVVHIEGIDLSKIHRVDFEIVEYLKANEPAIYQSLCDESRRAVPREAPPKQPVTRAVQEPRRVPIEKRALVNRMDEGFEPEFVEIDEAEDVAFERQVLSASKASDDGSFLYEETHALLAKRRY